MGFFNSLLKPVAKKAVDGKHQRAMFAKKFIIDNRYNDTIMNIVLVIPNGCNTEPEIKAIKSFELIAATLTVGLRVVPLQLKYKAIIKTMFTMTALLYNKITAFPKKEYGLKL